VHLLESPAVDVGSECIACHSTRDGGVIHSHANDLFALCRLLDHVHGLEKAAHKREGEVGLAGFGGAVVSRVEDDADITVES
jgi:hypothetical protein